MKTTFAIVLAAAVGGGLVGAVVGLALDGQSSNAGPTAARRPPRRLRPPSHERERA
jgi:hypothetical protein